MNRKTIILIAAGLLVAADAPKNDPNQADLKKMQGDWALASMTRDGMKTPDDAAQTIFRTVKGDQYTVLRFDKAIGKGTFKIDATKKPKTVDFFPDGTKDKTKAMHGIYEFDGAKLKYCYAPAGKDRPTTFSSKDGETQTLAIWEREKK